MFFSPHSVCQPISFSITGDAMFPDVSPFLRSILPIWLLSIRRSLMDLLAEALDGINGTWHVPRLRHMSFVNCFFVPEDLIGALRRRRAAARVTAVPDVDDVERYRPDVLEKLEVDLWMRDFLTEDVEKQLLCIVGKKTMRWTARSKWSCMGPTATGEAPSA